MIVYFIDYTLMELRAKVTQSSMLQSISQPQTKLKEACVIWGLNFVGIKFRVFRGFSKNRETKSRRNFFFLIPSLFDTKRRPWLISQR